MFTKAIVLSETEFNMFVNNLFEYFIEEHISEHIVDDKIMLSPEDIADLYEGFEDYLQAEYDFILENSEVDIIMVYYNNDWKEINRSEDFVYLVMDNLNISNIETFIQAIEDYTGLEVDIDE